MKTEKNILAAFILNLSFALFELLGGLYTGSVAIISDALHDAGDAAGIGLSYIFEKKSRRSPDGKYTFGYARYSVMGSVITTVILLLGSAAVIFNAVKRLFNPVPINYSGMIIFALVGVAVNLAAALLTRKGDSLNQKAVNLHMLEDVLGWAVVLIGAVAMKLTDLAVLDPLMSIAVAVFILINAIKNLLAATELFLEKTPRGIDPEELARHLAEEENISDVHHVHLWTLDGSGIYATMHIVTDGDHAQVKAAVRRELEEHGIFHSTLELESPDECCPSPVCVPPAPSKDSGHHHHHHGHHH